jgi:hypothetical protein
MLITNILVQLLQLTPIIIMKIYEFVNITVACDVTQTGPPTSRVLEYIRHIPNAYLHDYRSDNRNYKWKFTFIPRRKAAPLDRLQKTNRTVSCSIMLSCLEQKTKREGFSTGKPTSI